MGSVAGDRMLPPRRMWVLPPVRARSALARTFPAGTARERIASELARFDAAGPWREGSEAAVLERLADEIARAAMHDTGEVLAAIKVYVSCLGPPNRLVRVGTLQSLESQKMKARRELPLRTLHFRQGAF